MKTSKIVGFTAAAVITALQLATLGSLFSNHSVLLNTSSTAPTHQAASAYVSH